MWSSPRNRHTHVVVRAWSVRPNTRNSRGFRAITGSAPVYKWEGGRPGTAWHGTAPVRKREGGTEGRTEARRHGGTEGRRHGTAPLL